MVSKTTTVISGTTLGAAIIALANKFGAHLDATQASALLTALVGGIHYAYEHVETKPTKQPVTVAHKPADPKTKTVVKKAPKSATLGMWVWEGGDPHSIAAMTKAGGFGWIAVKVHDGESDYNSTEYIQGIKSACKAYGLKFAIWGYCRVAGDAIKALQKCREWDPAFYIADCEIEMENDHAAGVGFSEYMRKNAPHAELWLSTFGRPDFHTGIAYESFRANGFGIMPQAYECDSYDLLPTTCYQVCRDMGWSHEAIQPTLGVYKGAVFDPSPDQLASQVRTAKFAGVNVWDASTATTADLLAISRAV